jgi:hypothetical protein
VNLTLLPALKPPNYDAYAQVVEDEGIPLVETAGHYKVRQWRMSRRSNTAACAAADRPLLLLLLRLC